MKKTILTSTQSPDSRGRLQVLVTARPQSFPIENALVRISYTGNPEQTIEELRTDSSGQTPEIELPAPPLEYSLSPGENQPYSEYTLQISAPGYEDLSVSGTEILPGETAVLPASMNARSSAGQPFEDIVIPAHTLYGDYPPKISENEIKPVNETGEIVLSRVVIPEYVIVHDGSPNDSTAPDYYVRYRDYIKNVASSEIYATWPEETIRANVLAIMSFTLNRVYTEWYRNKGYDFTITSSTAYDQKWIYGRNIFDSISLIVDEIFTSYISRPNLRQPLFTQYCDGERVTCPNWLSQWGSKSLGERNFSAIEILRYYYGDDVYINTAEEISGIPASWPRYDLDIGASGEKVRQIQEQLNRIAQVYSAIPTQPVTGYYDDSTREAVLAFQKVFKLPQTGIIDYRTWYKIQEIYVGVTRIAELN